MADKFTGLWHGEGDHEQPGFGRGKPLKPADAALLRAAQAHDVEAIRNALVDGANVNCVHPDTGLSALHIAAGQNDLPLCRFLIEECGAAFFADRSGRWPTLIAAECQVDEALCDYIVEAEARFLEQERWTKA